MARKIGELASATGLTIRTLHYYEEIGLLPPPTRNAAGHRLYGEKHSERLYRILLPQLAQALSRSEKNPIDNDLLRIIEEMTMLDTTVQKRISILVYADLQGAYDYLVRVFGLGAGTITRDDDGRPVHAELHAGDGVVWLHPESEKWHLASPRSVGAATGMMAVMVDDVDAHFRHAKTEGAAIDYEPVDQPYGYREYSARDHEGGMWSFMKPIS
jgi:uncharacterized glyoxalase superfamily protein PhnB